MDKIYFFIGTTAELIKLFPIMQVLDARKIEYRIIASGQNKLDSEILQKIGNISVDIELSQGAIKQSSLGLLTWFVKTFLKSIFSLRKEFKKLEKNKRCMLVHGDTVSTVMGAVLGKVHGFKIVHIEAGLRSFNFLKPFPEEIDRMIVSKLTDVHCCPNEWSMDNIKSNKDMKINTIQNTLYDSLNYALTLDIQSELYSQLEEEKFFIFVFHRQENLFDKELTKNIMEKIISYSRKNIPALMIMHSPTQSTLIKYDMLDMIEKEKTIITTERLSYFEFMRVLSISEFIVTDGGSNQEESYYFGKPCLILRKETERNEGLGDNVVLSDLHFGIINEFFDNPYKYKKEFVILDEKPSEMIVSALVRDR